MRNRYFYSFLLFFSTVLLLVSCSKDDSPASKKYLLSNVTENGSPYQSLTYNSANKLINITASNGSGSLSCDISYNSSGVFSAVVLKYLIIPMGSINVEMNPNNTPSKMYFLPDSVTITCEYDVKGNLIKLNYYSGTQVSTDKNYGVKSLSYDNGGNVISEIFTDLPDETMRYQYDFEYDTKNSPVNVADIRWQCNILLEYLTGEGISYFLSKNNVTKITSTYPLPVSSLTNTYEYNSDGFPISMTAGTNVYNYSYIVK